jgi:hypothetical protein
MSVVSLSPSFLPKTAEGGVDRGRCVATLGEPAQRLVAQIGVVGLDVECERGVERVSLPVQRAARVLAGGQRVTGEELDVVQPRVGLVAL